MCDTYPAPYPQKTIVSQSNTHYTQYKRLSIHFLKTDHRFPDYFLKQETFVTSAQNVNQKQRLLTNWSSCSAGLILVATSQKLNQFMDLTCWAEVSNDGTVAQPSWFSPVFVCPFVCQQHYTKSTQLISRKLGWGMGPRIDPINVWCRSE